MDDPLHGRLVACLDHLRRDLANGRAQRAQLTALLLKLEGAVEVVEQLLAPIVAPMRDEAPGEEELCQNHNAAAPTNSP